MTDLLNYLTDLKPMLSLTTFLQKITDNETIHFNETLSVISTYYIYQATEFTNGCNEDLLVNTAGSNEGSCKIFSFANIHQLTPAQTLNLFGDFYHKEVVENPSGSNHKNIRNFIKFGWEGIKFSQLALTEK